MTVSGRLRRIGRADRTRNRFCAYIVKKKIDWEAHVDYVRSILHADDVHRAGITGRGITAAVLDSGEGVIILST